MIFSNSLDPDQAQQNVVPDLDPNRFDTLIASMKDFFWKKSLFGEIFVDDKNIKNTQHAASLVQSDQGLW